MSIVGLSKYNALNLNSCCQRVGMLYLLVKVSLIPCHFSPFDFNVTEGKTIMVTCVNYGQIAACLHVASTDDFIP